MNQFLNNYRQIQPPRNFLDAPQNVYGMNQLSVNSMNNAHMDPSSLNIPHNIVLNSNNVLPGVHRSNSSFSSNGKLLSLAERFKAAQEQQKQEKQDVIIQNYIER